jgi:hypothetical protein
MRFDEQNRHDDDGYVHNYFGTCPECHKTDGYINIGKSHWFLCKKHRTRWWVGSNLFSSWRDQTEEEQRRLYDELDFGSFRKVESYSDLPDLKTPRWTSATMYSPRKPSTQQEGPSGTPDVR